MACSSAIKTSFSVVLLFALAFRASATGALDYQVIYRGVFSAGADMPIADLRLQTPVQTDPDGIRQIGLNASSAAYPLVESLYPIRYRFRSWTDTEQGRLLGFETYESTGKLRHRLYLRDGSESGMRRYDLTEGKGRHEMAQLEAGISPLAAVQGEQLLDRLGLLQHVRRMDLRDQARFRYVVTDGRDRMVYQVMVQAARTLELDGLSIPAWKLRFDGLEAGRNGRQVAAHRPVYVWLSRASGHIPLRVDSRQPLGLFRVELKDPWILEQLAKAGYWAGGRPTREFSRRPAGDG